MTADRKLPQEIVEARLEVCGKYVRTVLLDEGMIVCEMGRAIPNSHAFQALFVAAPELLRLVDEVLAAATVEMTATLPSDWIARATALRAAILQYGEQCAQREKRK